MKEWSLLAAVCLPASNPQHRTWQHTAGNIHQSSDVFTSWSADQLSTHGRIWVTVSHVIASASSGWESSRDTHHWCGLSLHLLAAPPAPASHPNVPCSPSPLPPSHPAVLPLLNLEGLVHSQTQLGHFVTLKRGSISWKGAPFSLAPQARSWVKHLAYIRAYDSSLPEDLPYPGIKPKQANSLLSELQGSCKHAVLNINN